MPLFIAIVFMMTQTTTLYDFTTKSAANDWTLVNDGVMGGLSFGTFTINTSGHGVFSGKVSLENNGGFTSIRHRFSPVAATSKSQIVLRVKGDGKNYQFRIKDQSSAYYSYITTFPTTGEWETIIINLNTLYPSFRGRRLEAPNFNSASFEEIVFLIANKKNESFQLLLDRIVLQ
jgi:NADH dehydrogenase [ubiquinone] 1 alpha subcomplex assembly factor 1